MVYHSDDPLKESEAKGFLLKISHKFEIRPDGKTPGVNFSRDACQAK